MFGLSIAVVKRTNKKERLLLLVNKIKTPFLCCKATHTSIFHALKPPCVWVGGCVCARTSMCLVATGNVPDNGMGSNAFNGGCCRGNQRGIRSIKRRAAPSLCRKSPHRDGYVTYSESNWDGGPGGGGEEKRKMNSLRSCGNMR